MSPARLTMALLLVGSSACGGGSAAAPAGRPQGVIMPDLAGQGSERLRYTVEEGRTTHELEGSAQVAWTHLLAAYLGEGLDPDVIDEASLTVAVSEVTVTRRLGDLRLSRLVSCGSTMTGPVADQARVTFHVESRLVPVNEQLVRLHTRMEATAVPNDAAGGGIRQCSSRQVVESRIAESVQRELEGR